MMRSKSARSAGLKRLHSQVFIHRIDDDITDEINALGEFVNTDAVLVVHAADG